MNELKEYIKLEREHVAEFHCDASREGIYWKFPNGYGASIAFNSITHWSPELAVLKYNKEGDPKLVYDTPVTNNVISGVSLTRAEALLSQIKSLKKEAS